MSSLGTLTRNYSSNTSVQLLVHSKPNRNCFHPPPHPATPHPLTYELFTETPAISIYYDPPPPPHTHTKKKEEKITSTQNADPSASLLNFTTQISCLRLQDMFK